MHVQQPKSPVRSGGGVQGATNAPQERAPGRHDVWAMAKDLAKVGNIAEFTLALLVHRPHIASSLIDRNGVDECHMYSPCDVGEK